MNRIYKIRIWVQLFKVIFIFNFIMFNHATAQSKILNKYGLFAITNTKTLQKEIAEDASKQMINLRKFIPGIKLDLKRATTDNFVHEKLYRPLTTTFLRKPAADLLKNVAGDLKNKHLAMKIFDASRPYPVTELMWVKVKDDRYAADPSKGSGHNRRAAVDLTLIDLKTGKELPMGTGFDNFTGTAHADITSLPEQVKKQKYIKKSNGKIWV